VNGGVITEETKQLRQRTVTRSAQIYFTKEKQQPKSPADKATAWPRLDAGVVSVRSVLLRLVLTTGGGRFLSLVGKQLRVNVGQDTTLGDCHVAKKFVEFLIVTDGQLEVTGDDTRFLVVPCSIASQFENFSGKILEDGSEINGGTSTNTLSVIALAKMAMETTDWKLETSLGRARLRLARAFLLSTLSALARHV